MFSVSGVDSAVGKIKGGNGDKEFGVVRALVHTGWSGGLSEEVTWSRTGSG